MSAIVADSPLNASSFFLTPLLRLLMAPKIAGLLPAPKPAPVHVKPVDLPLDLIRQVLSADQPQPVVPQIAVPVSHDCVFEYAHVGLRNLSPRMRREALLAAEQCLDHIVDYLMGIEDNGDWASANQKFYRRIMEAKRDKPVQPASLHPHIFRDPTEIGNERTRLKHAEEGRKLAKVMADLLGIHVEPASGQYDAGTYRYSLHPWYGSDAIVIERLAPDSRSYIFSKKCFNRADALEALSELEAEFQRQKETFSRRSGRPIKTESARPKTVVEQGPIQPSMEERLEAIKVAQNRELQAEGERGFKAMQQQIAAMKGDSGARH